MKCYLINLDRAPERLARMANLLKGHGIEFERVAAFDARKFEVNVLSNYRSQRAEGLHDLAPGDIACGATHLSILNKIANGDEQYAVIMEDDLHLSQDISFYLKSVDWIPAGADIVKLETFREPTVVDGGGDRLPYGRKISRLRSKHLGAALYIISKQAATKIATEFEPGIECIDVYLFEEKIRELSIFQVDPAPAVQDNIGGFHSGPSLASDINDQRVFAKNVKPNKIAKIIREIKRIYQKSIRNIYYISIFVTINRKGGKIDFKL